MKKILLCLVLSIVSLTSFGQSKEEYVNRFLESSKSETIINKLKNYGTFDKNDCTLISRVLEEENLNILTFKIMSRNNVAGYLQVIEKGNLWFHQFISLASYSFEVNSGKVIYYDLVQNTTTMTMVVKNDKLIESIPGNSNYGNQSQGVISSKLNPMDTNKDGNVSFSECYKVVNDAIDADGFSSWVCDFPVLGWLSCWGSTTTACAVYSALH